MTYERQLFLISHRIFMDELSGMEYVDAAIGTPKTRRIFEEGEQRRMEKNVDK